MKLQLLLLRLHSSTFRSFPFLRLPQPIAAIAVFLQRIGCRYDTPSSCTQSSHLSLNTRPANAHVLGAAQFCSSHDAITGLINLLCVAINKLTKTH